MVVRIKRKCFIAARYNSFTIVTYCVSAVSCFSTGACNSFNFSCINVVIGVNRNFCICAFNSCLVTAVAFVICAVSRLGTGCILRIMVSYTICAVVVRIKRKCFIAARYNRFTIVTYCVSAVSCFGTGACNSFNFSCINVVIEINSNRLCLGILTYSTCIGLNALCCTCRIGGYFALVPAMLSAYCKSIGLLSACRFICNCNCVLNSSLTGNVNICYR